MDRVQKALENNKNGYNCAQAVACAFADKTDFTEDELFKLSEAFGGGMGGTQGVCGAVSAMVFFAGLKESLGISGLPQTNKIKSYASAREMMAEFESQNQTIICETLKAKKLRSCPELIEDAVRILEKYFGE